MNPIEVRNYKSIVFFTGAGMSAESGVPTYRGQGGIWHQYRWQEYACQRAFEQDPERVLAFHQLRRAAVLKCDPHEGHRIITGCEARHSDVKVVTQNIDGLHQRAGSQKVIELHGSLWRLRCIDHGVREDLGKTYEHLRCPRCNRWLRPDITWFEDMLDPEVVADAETAIARCDLFISIGTSAVVWPAAGMPRIAKENGATCIEINPEPTNMSDLYDHTFRQPASSALVDLLLI
jgi:NAD-dependent deacetylase